MKVRGIINRPFKVSLAVGMLTMMMLLAACVPADNEPAFGEGVPVTRAAATADSPGLGSPTAYPMPITPTPPDTPGPTLTPWDVPSRFPTRTPVPPAPGLVYYDESGLWQVSADWQPQKLAAAGAGASLSPDGKQALLQDGGDIWLLDLDSGTQRNLTQDQGRLHCCPQWWPARPGTIIFGSWPAEGDVGPTSGFLSSVQTDGRGYAILDETAMSNAAPAPGPDGRTIAYDRTGSAWLYDWEDGPRPIDLAQWGLENVTQIGGPSWSPDGRRLAWTASVNLPEGRIALVVFDFDQNSTQILHPYNNIGRGGWFPPPAWSPDGRYLAFVAEDDNIAANGVWVVEVDGNFEQYLGPGTNPSWSPDGRWLVFSGYEDNDGSHNPTPWLYEVSSWYPLQMYLPPGATIVGWAN